MNKKSIFITGAASGIGRETARLFSGKGWYVGITDMNAEPLKALEDELGEENCFARVMDVTDPESYQEAVADFGETTGGKMDVLFNNAGILRMGLNEEISLAEQHLTVDINIKGILNGIDAALPLLKKTPGARIVSMCSTSSVYGLPELAVYSATKHAVCALTEALDIELEKYGIKVCDIMAPYVATPMVTEAARQAHSVASTGVNLKPEQIAELVWEAAHGNKLHWKIHYLTYVLFFSFWLMPFLKRPLVKYLCLSK
jgi:NADP-dependent 3-hydroxy acid dehydrogenase YdfG